MEPLAQFLELSEKNISHLLATPRFPLNLPRRLAEKIEKNNLADPILRQFVPLLEERNTAPGFVPEPLQDQTFRKSKKLLQKYRGRALIVSTGACAMNCRFCFRQNFPYEKEIPGFDQEISYLQQNPSISEVILSGGDPLSLSDGTLASLFDAFEKMTHLKRIRFHTRFPIGIPERIDESYLALLSSSSKQIFFTIHCNHPRELDSDVSSALKKVLSLGIPVLNQSVLLRGVNDDEKTLLALSEALVDSGAIPYYLHLHDKVEGAAHFDVSEERGLALIQFLKENLSGFGVPRLVREEPGRSSKTFINP
jgi:EF-P beta-lysylation protein EpmB